SFDEVRLRDWSVKHAVRNGVRHLNLSHHYDVVQFPVPASALSGCRTLKTLELAHLDVSGLMSSSACFPAVTTLRLEDCNFDKFFNITDLSCPNLNSLHLLDFAVCGRRGGSRGGVVEISATKLVCLKMEGVGCDRIKLSAVNLQVFLFSNAGETGITRRMSDDFRMDLPCLQSVEVLLYGSCHGEEDKLMKLLYGIRNAASLKVNVPPLEVLYKAGLLKHKTSPYSNLKSLKLLVEKRNGGRRNKGRLNVPDGIRIYLLSGAPNPETVDIIIEEDEDRTELLLGGNGPRDNIGSASNQSSFGHHLMASVI
ncbi:hypothetical protein Tsubulata_046217, partial [Turnera subulata]